MSRQVFTGVSVHLAMNPRPDSRPRTVDAKHQRVFVQFTQRARSGQVSEVAKYPSSRKGPNVLEPKQAEQILGQPIYAAGQVEVGTVNQVYLDDTTGKPAWASVHTGVPGTKATFIPLVEATIIDGRLTVPYGKKKIAAAPRAEANDGHLTLPEVATLNRHYGLRDRTQPKVSPPKSEPVGDANGMTGDAAAEMTRSEERLKVATTTRATERVRMRKHVVVEERTITVSVQREEIVIEHVPLDDDNDDNDDSYNQGPAAGSGPGETDGSTVEHEMVLHEEQIFIEKRIVPVERVRLIVETVTTQQQVSEQLRKEQIDTDLPSH